jgi:alpha(1,3/1,4) fucosyltransferase
MDLLRLGFTDTIEPFANFFMTVLSREFTVIRDDENPDYLIFGDRNFGNNNVNYNTKNCVKIFYTGENQRPWDYQCHYAITFDHYDSVNHYRLPLYVIYDFDNKIRKVNNSEVHTRTSYGMNQEIFNSRKFCSFIVKNSNCEMRNHFFHKLSEYQQVDSAGPLFNNVGQVLEGGDRAVQSKLEFLPNYRFNLCFENASHPGYATEKLYEALVGNTVPIYWGSPTIEMDFNPKAFLSWHNYQDDDLFIEAIKAVNEDYYAYQEMYCQPMFRDSNRFMDLDRFVRWFRKNVYRGVINA